MAVRNQTISKFPSVNGGIFNADGGPRRPRIGMLFAYWNMEVAHDKNRKHGGEMQSSGVVRAVT